jgi:aarF domain-containing kinase
MLLDTGVLHCDPHKGNLLRTTDGRLCILDWGMTLDVPKDLQYALLEFIAHINVEDYDAIPQDFINLGFSPPDVTAERLQSSGITEGLSFTFRQLAAGGGPKKIQERVKAEFLDRYGSDLTDDELRAAAQSEMQERMKEQLAAEGVDVKSVTNIMEEVSKRNRELFSLPPYVLYLARAFSTLEGIGLSLDENYSIIQECYPYLASRLFTDRNPRAKKALKAMLGLREDDVASSAIHDPNSAMALVQQATRDATSSEDSKKNGGLSPAKLVEMTEGFASYTSSTTDVDEVGKGQAKAAAEFGKLFLDPRGSTLQDILVDETAKYGDALARRALRMALVDNPAARATSSILRGPKQLLGNNDSFFPSPLKSLLVDTPAGLPDLIESLVASTEEDDRIIATVNELRNAVGPMVTDGIASGSMVSSPNGEGSKSSSTGGSNNSVFSAVSGFLSNEEARSTLAEQLPGVVALSRRMGAGLLRRAAYRTEQAHELPEETRKQLADLNTALAKAVEPELLAESSSDN